MPEQYKLQIKLPREVSGLELADAVENAAKLLQGYEIGVSSDKGYKPGSVEQYEVHRTISIDPMRSGLRKWLHSFELPWGSYFLFGVDTEKTYTELLNEGTLNPRFQRFEEHRTAFETFVGELYKQLENSHSEDQE